MSKCPSFLIRLPPYTRWLKKVSWWRRQHKTTMTPTASSMRGSLTLSSWQTTSSETTCAKLKCSLRRTSRKHSAVRRPGSNNTQSASPTVRMNFCPTLTANSSKSTHIRATRPTHLFSMKFLPRIVKYDGWSQGGPNYLKEAPMKQTNKQPLSQNLLKIQIFKLLF